MVDSRSAVPAMVLCIVLVSMIVVGCQINNENAANMDPDVLVEFQVIGGVAGLNDNLVIMKDGQGTLTQPANEIDFQLSGSELQTLNSILDQIAFGDLRSHYESPNKVDNLEYTITYDGVTVRVQDGAAPAELEPLIAALNKIIVGLF